MTTNVINATLTEIVADTDKYITQSADIADSERMYLRRKMMLSTESLDDWRDATDAERNEWQARLDAEIEMGGVFISNSAS